MTAFAIRLKQARDEKRLTQKELADMVDIAQTTIGAYEKLEGAKIPSLEIAAKLAKALGVSLDWLAGLSNEKEGATKDVLDIHCIERPVRDYMRMLALLVEIGALQHPFDECALWFQQEEMQGFLSALIKMRGLQKEEIIDFEQYAQWLDGYIAKHGNQAVYLNETGKYEILPDDFPA